MEERPQAPRAAIALLILFRLQIPELRRLGTAWQFQPPFFNSLLGPGIASTFPQDMPKDKNLYPPRTKEYKDAAEMSTPRLFGILSRYEWCESRAVAPIRENRIPCPASLPSHRAHTTPISLVLPGVVITLAVDGKEASTEMVGSLKRRCSSGPPSSKASSWIHSEGSTNVTLHVPV